ncbi:AAA family ATPase [Niabella beijingensis]|uniref:AAA family ATPase n=1 Tax=Niabella beijingensis TaxID=2872700 RepID=UPI001CBFE350|nr:AAA family ATPase [Niabella beijingensis]MBZ4187437.1 AAA family ATPase [Niabella beijingensis]
MQIKNLEIKGLYGYINKSITFNNDLTLLVGINGSGKTSILNIVNWILRPSIAHLCVTEFKSIKLSFVFKDVDYTITCRHNSNSFVYSIQNGREKLSPLRVRMKVTPLEIKNDETLKSSLIQQYANLGPDQKEKNTWDLIATFPNPTIIGLDRTLYTEESEKLFIDESIRGKIVKGSSIQNLSPLDRVKEIVNREYRRQKNSILNLTSNLKNHLMLSTFAGSITLESFNSGIRHKLNLNQIDGAEKRVNDYFNNIEKSSLSDEDQKTITRYFAQLKEITTKYQANPDNESIKLLYGLNASQFVKVNKLLKEFEKFEIESNKALQQINTYISTLNFFLKDSSKQLLFKEDTSELSFHTIDKSGKIVTEFKDIKFLSSGEQQILILFSYIAFNSQDGKIFIIDEPELSLHIKWQEDFLHQLENVTPHGTQLILATHSPILANKKRDKAKLLLPYN